MYYDLSTILSKIDVTSNKLEDNAILRDHQQARKFIIMGFELNSYQPVSHS